MSTGKALWVEDPTELPCPCCGAKAGKACVLSSRELRPPGGSHQVRLEAIAKAHQAAALESTLRVYEGLARDVRERAQPADALVSAPFPVDGYQVACPVCGVAPGSACVARGATRAEDTRLHWGRLHTAWRAREAEQGRKYAGVRTLVCGGEQPEVALYPVDGYERTALADQVRPVPAQQGTVSCVDVDIGNLVVRTLPGTVGPCGGHRVRVEVNGKRVLCKRLVLTVDAEAVTTALLEFYPEQKAEG